MGESVPIIEFDTAFGTEMSERISEVMDSLVEGAGDEVGPSGWDYCGCWDCYERELIWVASALAVEGYVDGRLKIRPRPAPEEVDNLLEDE